MILHSILVGFSDAYSFLEGPIKYLRMHLLTSLFFHCIFAKLPATKKDRLMRRYLSAVTVFHRDSLDRVMFDRELNEAL